MLGLFALAPSDSLPHAFEEPASESTCGVCRQDSEDSHASLVGGLLVVQARRESRPRLSTTGGCETQTNEFRY